MAITGLQKRSIQEALLDAFDEAELRQLCDFELDVRLDSIVEPGPLKDRAFHLVDWAVRYGRIPDLIEAAHKRNPGNPKVQALFQVAQEWVESAEASLEVECAEASLDIVNERASVSPSRESNLGAAQQTVIEAGPDKKSALSSVQWIATVFLVPILLILLGLYLEHNTALFGGPTKAPTADETSVNGSHLPPLPATEEMTVTAAVTLPAIITPTTPTIGTTKTNPIDGAVYVYVPAGPFLTGSKKDDPLTFPNELPQESIDVGAFWIMETEVTNAQYGKCVESGSCLPLEGSDDPLEAEYPVNYVSWHDAKAYAEWADGRLPTDAEWEKACRGTSGQRYPWGDEPPKPSRANYNKTGWEDENLAEVGSYPEGASPYGALDMSGNVWEWTFGKPLSDGAGPEWARSYSSIRDEYYWRSSPPEDGEITARGGGYDSPVDHLRCTSRLDWEVEAKDTILGFRVVRTEL